MLLGRPEFPPPSSLLCRWVCTAASPQLSAGPRAAHALLPVLASGGTDQFPTPASAFISNLVMVSNCSSFGFPCFHSNCKNIYKQKTYCLITRLGSFGRKEILLWSSSVPPFTKVTVNSIPLVCAGFWAVNTGYPKHRSVCQSNESPGRRVPSS